MTASAAISLRNVILIALAALAFQAGVLYALGQPLLCACGHFKLWEGDVTSSGLSQQLTDWYSFTHIVHGILFYLLASIAAPRLPVAQRFLIALALEVGWEIAENTPFAIKFYRKQALAQGYAGDSVVNSLVDTLTMAFGFFLAWRLPVMLIVALLATIEIGLALAIRDNFTLNVLNFIHPFDAVHRWQSGAL